MSDWGEGYVTDLHYVPSFCREQSPAILRLACLLNGLETAPESAGFTYCDLGCGEGVTALVLAAAYPEGKFHGVDFNPGHIMRARGIAAAAALSNVEFLERSFEDLPDAPLPEFDFITLHGVYSWISPELRQSIVRFIARRLKPGGIVYVGYNAMPGSTSGLAVQRLLHDLGAQAHGQSDKKILWAMSILEKLKDAGAVSLVNNEVVDRIIALRDRGRHRGRITYLAHEYLNDHWHPMYHADVAREMSAAKLLYVGSADLLSNFQQFMVTPAQHELIGSLDDGTLRETVRDICCPLSFRQDIFIRGTRPMSAAKQEALLRSIRLALLIPRANFLMQLKVPTGNADLQPAYATVADALAARPHTVAELFDLPGLRGKSGKRLAAEIVGVLVGTSQAMAMRDPAAIDPGPADRLNRVTAAELEEAAPTDVKVFAAASLGSGVAMSCQQAMVLRNLLTDLPPDLDELSREMLGKILSHGQRVMKDGVPIESEAEALAITRANVSDVTSEMLPVWLTYWPHLRRAAGLLA
jgi:SAM-dependent methyltransferase